MPAEEFDSWIVCPKCMTSMIGNVGEKCFVCNTVMQATPLDERIAREEEYTPEERAILDELGL